MLNIKSYFEKIMRQLVKMLTRKVLYIPCKIADFQQVEILKHICFLKNYLYKLNDISR